MSAEVAASLNPQPAMLASLRSPDAAQARLIADILTTLPTRPLADALRRGLQAVETVQRHSRVQSGRLDRRALVRAQLGAPDVFVRRTTTAGMKTAVCVVVDGSGSMSAAVQTAAHLATRLDFCAAMLVGLMPALDRAGAETCAAMFQDGGSVGCVKPLKNWSGRATQAGTLQAASAMNAMAGTPMQSAVWWAHRQTLPRRVDRRVVLWLVDGQPDGPHGVREALRLSRAQGIEHYGIGVQCANLGSLFGEPNVLTVQDLTTLPKAIEALLLTGAKR
jgi:hypothetical protein